MTGSLSHYLNDSPFATLAIKFAVKDLLPRAEIEFAVGHRNDHLVVNENVLQVAVGVGLTGAMMLVILLERRESFQPLIDIAPDAGLVVIDGYAGRDVHCGNQNHAFANAALANGVLDFIRDENIFAVVLRIEPQVFGVKLHEPASATNRQWRLRTMRRTSPERFRSQNHRQSEHRHEAPVADHRPAQERQPGGIAI